MPGLISSAQAVEHYEITRYGTLRRWAEMLGKRNAAALLDRTLKEESQTDEQLNMIAEQANQTARKPASKSARKSSSRAGQAEDEESDAMTDDMAGGDADQQSGRGGESATS